MAVLSFAFIVISLVLEYWRVGDQKEAAVSHKLCLLQQIILYANFLCFFLLSGIKIIMYWQVARLSLYISVKRVEKHQQPQLTAFAIIRNLVTNYTSIIVLTILLLLLHIISALYHQFLPLLLFQVCFYYKKVPTSYVILCSKIIKAAWCPALLIYIIAWVFSHENFFNFDFIQSTAGPNDILTNSRVTTFMHFFLTDNHQLSWVAAGFENWIMALIFMMLFAAIFAHLGWAL